MDPGDQICCAAVLFFFAAVRWWQAALHVRRKELRISPNKVCIGSVEVGLPSQPWLCSKLLSFLVALPWGEPMEVSSVGHFFNKVGPLLLCYNLLQALPPPARGMGLEFDGGAMALFWWREARFYGGVLGSAASALLRRKGCGKESLWLPAATPREDLRTATCGVHQLQRSCAAVISGRGSHSVLWYFLCHRFFNLQAGVPAEALPQFRGGVPRLSVSKWCVPGDGADGCCVELLFLGGEGPDCVPHFFVEVLYVKARDLVVFSFFFSVLDVICKPTV